jgi:hypothetical protein
MAEFFTTEVSLNWYLERFEKYTGQKIRYIERHGYREQARMIYLQDSKANEYFSAKNHQFRICMDMGTLDFTHAPEAGDLCVKVMFEKENPGTEVVSVRNPAYCDKWVLTCRKENGKEKNND